MTEDRDRAGLVAFALVMTLISMGALTSAVGLTWGAGPACFVLACISACAAFVAMSR